MKLVKKTTGLSLLSALGVIGSLAFAPAASATEISPTQNVEVVASDSSAVDGFGTCTPHATVSNGSPKSATGYASCDFTSDWVGVAVTLYLGGVNEGNTYVECTNVDTFNPCYGSGVSRFSSSAACARTVVTYHTPLGTTAQSGISVGTGCPI